MKVRNHVGGVALGMLLGAAAVAPAAVEAQGPEGRWPLQPRTAVGRVVAPFLEGWYPNEDGTISYSFGYLNMNEETTEIPIGEGNMIEPAEYNGMQPTVFLPGRHRGMFAVTVPASMREADIWWTITNPDGEVTRVPGRTKWSAYMLDWIPRPHGSVPPEVAFDGGQAPNGLGPARGVPGVIANTRVSATVGAPTTLSVNIRDLSVRDPADPRFREPTSLRVVWTKHQGPVGENVEFTRHESTPIQPAGRGGRGGGGGGGGDGDAPAAESAETILVPEGQGTVRVVATFSQPGDYLINAQVDNWRSPDSGSGDQCCWSNGYVRVTVR
jgi:hypothetical protein